jgi:hypothetical protein
MLFQVAAESGVRRSRHVNRLPYAPQAANYIQGFAIAFTAPQSVIGERIESSRVKEHATAFPTVTFVLGSESLCRRLAIRKRD